MHSGPVIIGYDGTPAYVGTYSDNATFTVAAYHAYAADKQSHAEPRCNVERIDHVMRLCVLHPGLSGNARMNLPLIATRRVK